MILTIYNNKSDNRVVSKNLETITQISELQMRDDFDVRNGIIELDTINGPNLYNPELRTQNHFIRSDGMMVMDSDVDTSDFIYSQGYITISYNVISSGRPNCYVAFYDNNKNFVERASYDAGIGVYHVQWSGYIRFCINKTRCDPLTIMINNGSEALQFVPYGFIDLSRANYCHIDDLNRYYYITDVTADGRTGRWRLNLKCDVLMTFASGIRSLSGTVDRQQNKYNGYIPDGEYKQLAYSQITAKAFPNAMNNDTLILMTVG